MKIFSSLICFFCFGALWISCTKKSDPAPQVNKADLLTASTWKVEDVGLDQNRDGIIESPILAVYPCLKDNTITFRKDNTGTTDDGIDKCNTSAPPTATISWSFTDAETNLLVSNSTFTEINGKSKILQLNSTSLILNKDTTFMGSPTSFSVRLKH